MIKLFLAFGISVLAFLGWKVAPTDEHIPAPMVEVVATDTSATQTNTDQQKPPQSAQMTSPQTTVSTKNIPSSPPAVSSESTSVSKANPLAKTSAELLSMAGPNPTAIMLGDGKYVTTGPKKGYVYLCAPHNGQGGGAQGVGSWIRNNMWYPAEKIAVQGHVTWSNAVFQIIRSGASRLLSGNGLPLTHSTGVYPIATNDPAYQIDRNPNSIQTQNYSVTLAEDPVYLETPACIGTGGAIGYMTTGVALFDAFDELGRDAVAHEVQDSCDGHPQQQGQYHYHGPSVCMKEDSVTTVMGYAVDGFPITGAKVAEGKYLLTEDLDECHGIVSDVQLDGKIVSMYHYVMTADFPYSISCFRGKVSSANTKTTRPQSQIQPQGQMTQPQSPPSQQGGGMQGSGSPPSEAINACTGKASNSACAFSTPHGTISGMCRMPPGQQNLACIPS